MTYGVISLMVTHSQNDGSRKTWVKLSMRHCMELMAVHGYSRDEPRGQIPEVGIGPKLDDFIRLPLILKIYNK